MRLYIERVKVPVCAGLGVALLTRCAAGGMGGSSASISPLVQSRAAASRPVASAASNVAFSIRITPRKKTARIKPQYVSPNTQSLKILTDGTHPVIVNLTPSSPNCAPDPAVSGSFVCTTKFAAAAGDRVFTVLTYDSTAASGSVLSTNSTGPIDVLTNEITFVPIVLEGVVKNVILTLGMPNPPIGAPAVIPLTVVPQDADNDYIIGSAPYRNPVTLTTTNAAAGPISKSVLNSPADLANVSVNYTGANVASITFAARAAGLPPANVTGAVLVPGGSSTSQQLYVTNAITNTVSVYDTSNPSAAPATISGGGMNFPDAAAVDASGKLYVASSPCGGGCSGPDFISIFDTLHGNAVLTPITGSDLNLPLGLTVDAAGRLYVANAGTNSVAVFDTTRGNAPLPAITGGNLRGPQGVAIDAQGKLYVSNINATAGPGGASVSVFDTAHGDAALPPLTGICSPSGLALDPRSGKLYVGDRCEDDIPPIYHAHIHIFDTAHGNVELPEITGVLLPWNMALDNAGKLYVIDNSEGFRACVFDTTRGNLQLPSIPAPSEGFYGIAVH